MDNDTARPAKKYLVITSDDFGMCHAINAGILQGLTDGVLTSTTLMAPCPWFPEAAAMTVKHGLKAGIHFCLTCEWDRMRWGPITHAPSLLAPDGYLQTNYPDLVKSAKDSEVLTELEAQVARVKASGITPTHADIHMLSGHDDREGVERIRELVRRTCQKHGLVYTRDYSPQKGLLHFTGQASISELTESEKWETLAGWTAPGFYHLVAHVATAMSELDAICSAEHRDRRWAAPYRLADALFVLSPSTRRRLGEMGFELIDVPFFLAMKKPGR